MIALPVDGSILYTESIYLQANEARMPQLKKVVLAMGDRLIYRDTFDEALAELRGAPVPSAPATTASGGAAPAQAPTLAGSADPALAERIRRLSEQAEELAKELQTLEKDTQKK